MRVRSLLITLIKEGLFLAGVRALFKVPSLNVGSHGEWKAAV